MAKKIDLKRTLGSPSPTMSVDSIEEMTRMIHAKKEPIAEPASRVEVQQPKVEVAAVPKVQKEKTVPVTKKVDPTPVAEPAKRGRKPSPPASDERMIRVSVDLPESVFIKLKIKVIQEKTDMKTFVWRLVEKEMNK
jgi:hypothetical protein